MSGDMTTANATLDRAIAELGLPARPGRETSTGGTNNQSNSTGTQSNGSISGGTQSGAGTTGNATGNTGSNTTGTKSGTQSGGSRPALPLSKASEQTTL